MLLDLDLRDERPCALRGQITLHGQPDSEGGATLWPGAESAVNETQPSTRLDGEGQCDAELSYRVEFAVDPEDRQELDGMPAGSARLLELAPKESGAGARTEVPRFQRAPGQKLVLDGARPRPGLEQGFSARTWRAPAPVCASWKEAVTKACPTHDAFPQDWPAARTRP